MALARLLMEEGYIQVRSFRVVFDLERRIHKIDRWRIPVPYGVPLRGVGYAAAALFLVMLTSALPVVGGLARLMAPPLRLVVLPVAVAYVLTRIRADGRPIDAMAVAWLRYATGTRRLSAFRSAPRLGCQVTVGQVVVVPDERGGRFRRAVVFGPARVCLRLPARACARKGRLRLHQESSEPMLRGRTVELAAGQRLEVGG